jgi:nondiscriminating aspartyl-tRNA synthetase
MKKIAIKDIKNYNGQVVTVSGFVESIRDLRGVQFVILRDRTGMLQLFAQRNAAHKKLNTLISSLTKESVITATGTVNVTDHVKLNQVELVLQEIHIESLSLPELPIDETSPQNLLLDWRFLDLRRPKNLLVFEVQTALEHAMREYWTQNGFIEIHSPKLMGTASESGAELFELPYFGGKAYLAQSPQFYKQMGIAAGFDKVFEIGPVFRANSSFTKRHDTEFTSVDVEFAWVESHEDVMKFEEEWIAYILTRLKEKLGARIKEMYGVEVEVPTLPFPRMTLTEGRKILETMGHHIHHKDDLDPEGERLLAKYVKEKYNHDFIFLTEYPTAVRAFYHMRPVDNQEVTKSFDLIYRGIEITTGAQREHRADILTKQAIEKGYSLEPLKDYINFFKYGCPPHGGFGFGLTRLIMMLLGLDSVKPATYLFRGPNRLTP